MSKPFLFRETKSGQYSRRAACFVGVSVVVALVSLLSSGALISGTRTTAEVFDQPRRVASEAVQIESQRRNDFCSQTARALFASCQAEVTDNSFKQKAICLNISDATVRDECFDELETAQIEGNQLCQGQRDERLNAC